MPKARLHLVAMIAALGFVAAPVFADSTDRTRANESIAGKAAEKRAAPARSTPQRKRYEFSGAAVAAPNTAAKAALPQDSGTADPAMKDKSHCHSRGSDA